MSDRKCSVCYGEIRLRWHYKLSLETIITEPNREFNRFNKDINRVLNTDVVCDSCRIKIEKAINEIVYKIKLKGVNDGTKN